jgi:two-component system sensor histidine kinase RegB
MQGTAFTAARHDVDSSFFQLVKLRAILSTLLIILALTGWLLDYQVTGWSVVALLLITHLATNLTLPTLPANWRGQRPLLVLFCSLDLLFILALLAVSGGVSNGLVALLLLPVAIVSVLMPAWISYLFALAAIGSYSLLLWMGDMTLLMLPQDGFGHHALHQHLMQPFSRHMWQMWFAFTICAVLMSWFISRQTALIIAKSQQLGLLQQQQIRQEQALAIATYAANAAHDLASPIQNLLLLTDEVKSELAAHPALPEIEQQLARCQQIVNQLRQNAGQWREQQAAELLPLVRQSIQSWIVTRPEIQLQLTEDCDQSQCWIREAPAFSAALFQILDNAADAGLQQQRPRLQLQLQQSRGQLKLTIIDFGEGLSEQRLAELGHVPQQSNQGLGLGQFLANISIERLGGQIRRCNLPQGGMATEIDFQDQRQTLNKVAQSNSPTLGVSV